MAKRLRRTEIEEWLAQHKGQKGDYRIEEIDIPNPKYTGGELSKEPVKIKETRITWYANDGQSITVAAIPEAEATQPTGGVGPTEDFQENPEYRVIEQGPAEPKESTADRRRADALHREAQWNLDNGPGTENLPPEQRGPAWSPEHAGRGSGIYEDHATRIDREDKAAASARAGRAEERQIAAQERQAEQDRIANELREKELKIRETAEGRQSEISRGQLEVAQGRLSIEQEEAERKGRTPTVLGTPTDAQERIAYIDPQTGEIKFQANPLYDQLKTESARKREELKIAVELNKMSLDQATAEYTRWFDQNVRTPLMLSQERRAQATEKRQALQAEEQRRQFRAQNEIARAQVGQQAAEMASANERAMLPFRAGPKFGEQFSSAINSLAAGGRMDTNAAAGINFTADAFEFDAPNFKKIAKNATREALKHLTPYDPSEESFALPDYSGIAMPTTDTMAGAPGMPNLLDINSMVPGALPSYNPPIPINSGG